ncbi:MAG: hypothetical protein NT001_03015 [Candidatus Woesearchaeota archaeon]|nr:hypothetical protein [Candidatus Woesearchaeota archaeon]
MKIRTDFSLCAILAVLLAVCIMFSGCGNEVKKAADIGNTASASAVSGEDNAVADVPKTSTENPPDETASDQESNTTAGTEDNNAAQFELEYTLKDMQEILRRGMYFIVGNKAPAVDIVTISEMKSALSYKGIDTGDARLADEVADYTNEDYVVIGSPCDNPVAAKLLAAEIRKKSNCNIFQPGTGWIKIFQTSEDHIALYIGGGSAADTRKTAKVVENFEDHNLQGATVEVSGSADNPELNMVIN